MAWRSSPQRGEDDVATATEKLYIDVNLTMHGVAPLLMHAPTLVDPLHPLTRQMADLTAKKQAQRTTADWEAICRTDHRAGLYYDDDLGPVIPTIMIKKAMQEAGGRWKLGAKVKRGVIFTERIVRLDYDGPRDIDGLYDAGFVDHRPVKNGGMNAGRVLRSRPCFDAWSIDTSFKLDPHELGLDDLGKILERAQVYGIGDYRPEFGLFSAAFEVIS
jgi:hypothetical protein